MPAEWLPCPLRTDFGRLGAWLTECLGRHPEQQKIPRTLNILQAENLKDTGAAVPMN